MKIIPQNNRQIKPHTTGSGFFVDSTLERFVLKQPGKNREIRFLGKIYTPMEEKNE